MAEGQDERAATPPPEAGEELLSLMDAAQFLGISQRTVQRLLERGELKGTKVGRQWRFRSVDLTAYVSRAPVAIAAPPEEDLRRAEASLAGWAEEVTLTLSTFSGEADEPDAVVPAAVARLAHRIVQQA